MKLRAPGFAQVHKAAGNTTSPSGIVDVPPAEVRWAIPWQVGPCELCKFAQQHVVQNAMPGSDFGALPLYCGQFTTHH